MSALITGKLLNESKTNSDKNLTQSVCFNHWLDNDWTQNQLFKLDNKKVLIYSLFQYQKKSKTSK